MLLLKGSALLYSFFSEWNERKNQWCSTAAVLSIVTHTFDLASINDVTPLNQNYVPPGNLMAN